LTSIDAHTLREKLQNDEDILLVDVREPWEHDAFNIGGLLIPMGDIFKNIAFIPRDKPVIFYCEKGIRSALVIQRLQQKFNYTNLINLSAGMAGWRKDANR
jgi:adenylyltransferase/sulfurtransferase